MSRTFVLKNILYELYDKDAEYINKRLSENDLISIINKQLIYLNQETSFSEFRFIVASSSFLQSVNERLALISDNKLKSELEGCLSSIGNFLIDAYVAEQSLDLNSLTNLQRSFQELSKMNNYNYEELDKYTNLSRLINAMNGKTSSSEISVKNQWLLPEYKLNNLAYDLKKQGVIVTVSEFKSLFSDQPYICRINKDHSDYLVVLFSYLYDAKFYCTKGGKGKFIVLQSYGVDFSDQIIYKKSFSSINYRIKKNQYSYAILLERVTTTCKDLNKKK